MPAGEDIRVAIIEDDAPTREGLAVLVDATPGYRCVGRFSSVEDALKRCDDPHVILLDIHLSGMPGSEGVKYFRTRFPAAQILMLTVFAEREKVFESVCNGACGYLLKKTPPAKLLDAIAEAHGGGAPMSPEIARKVIGFFHKSPPAKTEMERLSGQEKRLLDLLAEGYSYQAAADQLRISVNTVRNYVRSIYEKLHVHSKSEAVSKALRGRIIS